MTTRWVLYYYVPRHREVARGVWAFFYPFEGTLLSGKSFVIFPGLHRVVSGAKKLIQWVKLSRAAGCFYSCSRICMFVAIKQVVQKSCRQVCRGDKNRVR